MLNTKPVFAFRPPAFLRNTFAALKHPNYRLWFTGQLVSLIGTWMQITAQGYLVYELTHSPAYLGYVGFAAGLPTFMLTLYGGVLADRVPRRTLLIITQAYMMTLAIILAGLVFSKLVQPWHVIVLAFLLGIGNSFDAPARQSFVVELVGHDDLANAIALNSSMFTSANAIGPAVAGITYAAFGPAWCFTINAISFIAVILALALMRLKPQVTIPASKSTIQALGEAFRFVKQKKDIILLLASIFMVGMFGMSLTSLIPAWAVDVLKGDVKTNGWLLSARGVGALMGALTVAAFSARAVRGKLWSAGSILLPCLMLLFSFMRAVPLSLFAMVLVGWAFLTIMNTSNALVQLRVTDALRGRVMGLYILVVFGALPIGTLLMGWLAEQVNAPFAVWLAAGMLAFYFLFIWIHFPEVRKLE
ncbi:MAG: MFS transporter [Anaerolineaceae bacterium]|nr:MFS transporter [Anaerolineaceae bacterium]